MLETSQVDRRVNYVSRDGAQNGRDDDFVREAPEGKFRVNASAWEDGKTILADQVLELRFRNEQVLVLRRPKLPDPEDMSKAMMELWGWEEK